MAPTNRNKILVVLTNTSTLTGGNKEMEHETLTLAEQQAQVQQYTPNAQEWLTGQRTGFDVKAVAYIWKSFHKKEGMTVDFCTPHGGRAPLDPKTLEQVKDDSTVQEFLRDRETIEEFKDTDKVGDKNPREYCAIICPGSHGALVDLPKCTSLTKMITEAYENGATIATLGHGIAALLEVEDRKQGRRDTETGTTSQKLLKGKRVACFSNKEEEQIKYTQYVPFLVEDKVRQIGAQVEVKEPFTSNVVTDANNKLITAQNMASTKDWIAKMCDSFKQ